MAIRPYNAARQTGSADLPFAALRVAQTENTLTSFTIGKQDQEWSLSLNITFISRDGMVKTDGYSSRRQPVLDSASFDPHVGDAKSTNPITSLYRPQEEY
jgi:hypothetical protein